MTASYRNIKHQELLHIYAVTSFHVENNVLELKDNVQQILCGMSCYLYIIVLDTIFHIYGCTY